MLDAEAEVEEDEDDDHREKKKMRYGKGKKAKIRFHAHTQVHIPLTLAPNMPVLRAQGLDETEVIDEDQFEKWNKLWAWGHQVPNLPAELPYLDLIRQLGAMDTDMKRVRTRIGTYRTTFKDARSKATALLHDADLKFKAVEAMNGGSPMTDDDQKALMNSARTSGMRAESMLSQPAGVIATIIHDETGFPALKREFLKHVVQTHEFTRKEEDAVKMELKRVQKIQKMAMEAMANQTKLSSPLAPRHSGEDPSNGTGARTCIRFGSTCAEMAAGRPCPEYHKRARPEDGKGSGGGGGGGKWKGKGGGGGGQWKKPWKK